MSERQPTADRELQHRSEHPSGVRSAAYTLGVLNALAGMLGLVGPLVWYNDDDGLVNTEPGLFLGLVAVNGRHALLHVLNGLVGVLVSWRPDSARRYLGVSGTFWGAFAAIGWRSFGFRRGIHALDGLAVDRWGNVGHTLLSGVCFVVLRRSSGR